MAYHPDHVCYSRPSIISTATRSLLPSITASISRTPKNLKVVVFGPGLDRAASNLIYDLMWGGERSPLVTVGLIPNTETHGVGGGVVTQYKENKISFVTLYRATKAERESLVRSATRTNKIIQDNQTEHQSRMICSSADAIVYISDPYTPIDEEIKKEFDILAGRKDLNIPILILHPTPQPEPNQDVESWDRFLYQLNQDEGKPFKPLECSEIVDGLNLGSLSDTRRWWIFSFNPKGDLNDISKGIDWILAPPAIPSITSSIASMASNVPATVSSTVSFFSPRSILSDTISNIQNFIGS